MDMFLSTKKVDSVVFSLISINQHWRRVGEKIPILILAMFMYFKFRIMSHILLTRKSFEEVFFILLPQSK